MNGILSYDYMRGGFEIAHTEHRVTFYRMGQGAWRRNMQAQVPTPAL